MSSEKKGLFVTFEGPDGGGKTTQITLLSEYLVDKGFDVITTFEPGGTPISVRLREIVHDLKNQNLEPGTELLIYQAARRQHVFEKIKPHLEKGGIVLSDRYADSTTAYQGFGRGIDMAIISWLINFATDGLKPDLTLLLDVEPLTGIERRRAGQGEWNRMDAQAHDFHERARLGFLTIARQEPERVVVLDASYSVDKVAWAIRLLLNSKLGIS